MSLAGAEREFSSDGLIAEGRIWSGGAVEWSDGEMDGRRHVAMERTRERETERRRDGEMDQGRG
jgi:hypothetical protein